VSQPEHESELLPDHVRSYAIGKKGAIPSSLSATFYREDKLGWLCSEEHLTRWRVQIPNNQRKICPPVHVDVWKVEGQQGGPLRAHGANLSALLREVRRLRQGFPQPSAKVVRKYQAKMRASRALAEEQ